MLKKLRAIFLESLISILPIFLTVLILHFANLISVDSISGGNEDSNFLIFGVSCILILFGLIFFNLGTDSSLIKMGEVVGSTITKRKNILAFILVVFLIGVSVTLAEPDVRVVCGYTGDSYTLVWILFSVGVGAFLVIAALRILFQLNLRFILICLYGLGFALALLVEPTFLPFIFDGAGATTGTITVPFLLAFGSGVAITRGSKKQNADSFGLLALGSLGPILVMLIFCMILKFMNVDSGSILNYANSEIGKLSDPSWRYFGEKVLTTLVDVSIGIAPITIFFLFYDLIFVKLPVKEMIRIFIGLLNIYIGLFLFLTGVNGGFSPIAHILGINVGGHGRVGWEIGAVALVVGFILGFFATMCEPSVKVLGKQVQGVSDGIINKNSMTISLAISVGIAVVLSILRMCVPGKINFIFILVPGYILAFALSFFCPSIYTSIGFDSGGVASGSMVACFVLPFCIGVGENFGLTIAGKTGDALIDATKNIFSYSFGVIALVALMPLIVVQSMGVIATIKQKKQAKQIRTSFLLPDDNQIIHFVGEGDE